MYPNHKETIMDILSERLKNKLLEVRDIKEFEYTLNDRNERSFLNMLASEIQDFFYYGGE